MASSPWLIQHVLDNPGHTTDDPGNGTAAHCLACGESAPSASQAEEPLRTWEVPDPWTLSRRHFLEAQAMMHGAGSFGLAREAVASVAIEHPEWNMDERRTWEAWTAELEGNAS